MEDIEKQNLIQHLKDAKIKAESYLNNPAITKNEWRRTIGRIQVYACMLKRMDSILEGKGW